MSDFEKQLEKVVRSTKLTAAEKRELKARVVSYMEYHPRRETVSAQKAAAYIESQPYTILSIHNRMVQAAMGAFAVFIFIIVPAVAERAVPGDVLYPIKVSINEEVRSSFTFGTTEKIEWETERLERRIAEVRLLAEEGKLTEEAEAKAAEAVKEHAEAAQDSINKLKESDVDGATLAEVEFESALEVQTAVLAADQADSTTTVGISEVVKEAQEIVEATKGVAIPAFDRIAGRLEVQTTRAYEFFASLDSVLSDEERSEIERRLQDIERKVEAGAVLHEEEKVVPDILLEALADTQKLISFMTDIDVRVSVALEELVPVVLTDEEKIALVAEQEQAASTTLEQFALISTEDMNPDTLEKLEAGIALIETALDDLEVARLDEDMAAQVAIGADLAALAENVATLLKLVEETIELPETTDIAETGTSTEVNEAAEDEETEGEVGTDTGTTTEAAAEEARVVEESETAPETGTEDSETSEDESSEAEATTDTLEVPDTEAS